MAGAELPSTGKLIVAAEPGSGVAAADFLRVDRGTAGLPGDGGIGDAVAGLADSDAAIRVSSSSAGQMSKRSPGAVFEVKIMPEGRIRALTAEGS